ncbi:hypothetical protein CA54_33920 [Symmachiella macrocystis]|uniref:Uncharacterized protein n=1 Tax=Symmachiella macrocystis TaxID=2527985 RepID=A0A5C6BR83_9PLAN|nr:hypothetical protein [Symmachiella macrocystis]TWU14525.1 hypothetical protein CA54_33920 [Symmachiella macrocystis]
MSKMLRWGCVAIVSSAILWLTTWDANAKSVGKARPWKGSGVGQGVLVKFIFVDPNDPDELGTRVDEDTIVGNSTHMGRITVTPGELDEDGFPTSGHTFSFDTGEIEGWANWRAANGDKLYVTYAGSAVPNTDPDTMGEYPFAANSEFIAAGGTGRFKDATGEMTMHVVFSFPETGVEPIDYIFDFEGTLTY